MNMMKRNKNAPPPPEPDRTAWIVDSGLAEFLLFHTHEIKYMCMLGYTFYHGCKLFPTLPPSSSIAFKFVSMVFQCNGGGILVPIFINSIPITLGQDAYLIAIAVSFGLHLYYPMLREVVELSALVKTTLIVLYEAMRAYVIVRFTTLAQTAIAPSDFAGWAVFGPIVCGALAGCGGVFLPFTKGLAPIMDRGLSQPMQSALVAAIFYHVFTQTSLSAGVERAAAKAHVVVAVFLIGWHWYLDMWPQFQKSLKSLLPSSSSAGETKKTK